MSDYLPAHPLLGGLAASREAKALARHLRSLQENTSLELAHVQAAEALAIAKIDALEATGHIGLAAAASLGAHRRLLAEQDPTAIGYLNSVGEPAVRSIGREIEQLSRRLS